MSAHVHPVILSGGSGTRLWPLSRKAYPKQFLALRGNDTLLQETAQRVGGNAFHDPIVVCNNDHRFIVAEQLREVGVKPRSILLEPVGRNTAPAIAAAALHLEQVNEDALMLVLPSDHIVQRPDEFRDAVELGSSLAADGALVTFGIKPTRAETGYGYVEKGKPHNGDNRAFRIASFREKPDAATAEAFFEGGHHLWNSGMFLFSARKLLEELRTHAPAIVECCLSAIRDAKDDLDFTRLSEGPFARCPSLPIDKAVMERTGAGVVIPVDMGWSDIGAWSALWEMENKDEDGNVAQGPVVTERTKNCYIRSNGALVATVDVEDLAIVATDDAIMVSRLNSATGLTDLVAALEKNGRQEHVQHSTVYRPWGSYQCVVVGPRFQVKQIVVKPGEKLSVQMHFHRAEHWVVVQGTARVHRNGESYVVSENQSTYIALGETHSLENPGKVPLRLIEVQSGSYLGEDDIVRFEDQYGRC